VNTKIDLQEQEKVAGYFYIGITDQKLEERAQPNMKDIIKKREGEFS